MTDSPMPPPYQPGNVQGLILRGYTHRYSCHMLFTFTDGPGATAFIRALFPFVQSAADWDKNKPKRMLNIGLTFNGLRTFKLGFEDQFPPEFQAGPWSADSQLSLRDTGPGCPERWWNGCDNQAVHCIVHIYGISADELGGLVTMVSQAAQANKVSEILPLKPESGRSGRLEQFAEFKDFVHFGYKDGIDNPGLGWSADPTKSDPGDANSFLIGYPG